jgi:hypothetical protein
MWFGRATLPIPRIVHNVSNHTNRHRSSVATPKKPFQILFMGGDEFSCLVFEQLIAAKGSFATSNSFSLDFIDIFRRPDLYEHIYVVTNPPEAIGRGLKNTSARVYQYPTS